MDELCRIAQGDNLDLLEDIQDGCVDLIYIDPPFNTGKVQEGKAGCYPDHFSSTKAYINFLMPRIEQAFYILRDTGSLFVHVDQHMSHYVKACVLDPVFGEQNFRNEIIWAYDYGGRSKRTWPAKHDTIFWYSKSAEYTFNYDAIDRIPYMAPGLVGPEKAAKGKVPTDVWWQTIVPTQGKERTGYPTQKPLKLLERIVKVHSNPGDLLLDFFAGSGTFGEAALLHGRRAYLIDKNPEAIQVMIERLKAWL